MSVLKCNDIRSDISLYGDGCLSREFENALQEHLAICPICRQELFEYREMRSALRSLSRTQLPAALREDLKGRAIVAARPAMFSFPRLNGFAWRQNLLPLVGSSLASVLVGFALFSYLLSGVLMHRAADQLAAVVEGHHRDARRQLRGDLGEARLHRFDHLARVGAAQA